MGFVHLHNHTEYSLLDGANRIPNMVHEAKAMGMDALAITDHGVMFGVMEFSMECQKQGVKPLIGVEAYVAPKGYKNKAGREDGESYHLLLLAKDDEGYRNLCKLSTIAAIEGYYYKPRIDHELLRRYSRGLIGTTTCLGSEVCQELLQGNYDQAQYIAGMYAEIFGEGNYFVELQDHRLPEQARIRESLIRISRELKLPVVATNDAHYLCKTDAKAHDVLLCIQTGALVADERRMRFDTDEFYVKSPQEMSELFKDIPEAIENTQMVADLCHLELGKQRADMPDPELPPGETPQTYLRKLATERLAQRRGADEQSLARLDYELGVIAKTGFESYFLLVKEFAEFTRKSGIYFGVRGSAAASLVSYSLGITDVDPLEYDLTFERFLNPERISMPDIDMDFEDARRDEVIKWVTERYGSDHVAQIVTFGTLGAKAAIRDCGRVQGYSPQECDRICKTLPNLPNITLSKAIADVAEFRQLYETDPRVKSLVDVARSVEGISRHSGVHAAGIVISKEPLVEHIPLYKGNDGQAITAFEMGILEKIGLLKMDFLGLSNLTVLARAVANIEKRHGVTVNVQELPLDDQAAYDILARGETVGIFQLESGGMTRYVKELKPATVRELAAMVALYRPGPMEQIPKFIDSKFGRFTPTYLDERMRPILEETYGIIVYQDQVLKLVQTLAGFSLGKADLLRRAMGKKDKKAMDSLQVDFYKGCEEQGVAKDAAEKVWVLLEPFADYAFNKAHAVCYAILAYQTAYLKANYPVEFMAALLEVYRDKEDRVVAFIEECRRMKIPVLPPDINRSEVNFAIEMAGKQAAIRFGLVAIKGVGSGVATALVHERSESGPFSHLFEIAERGKPHGVNRSVLEALVKAGALDGIQKNRRVHLERIEGAIAFGDASLRNRLSGQESLFESGSDPSTPSYPPLPDAELYGRTELLTQEKEVMGIYVSDHPLRGYERVVQSLASHTAGSVAELDDGQSVKLAGVIASLRTTLTKSKGERMAHFVLEDFSGQASVIAFPATYAKCQSAINKDAVVRMSGVVMHRERPGGSGEKTIEIRLEDIATVDPVLNLESAGGNPDAGAVEIRVARATRPQFLKLREVLARHPGDYEVRLQVMPREIHLPYFLPVTVAPDTKLVAELRAIMDGAEIEVFSSSKEAAEMVDDGLTLETASVA